VIEAAGTGASASTALALAARGAMVILLGLPPHGTRIEFGPDDVVNNDIVIQGSFAYTSQSFSEVVEQVNAGHLGPSFLITHRYGIEGTIDAIDVLRGGVTDDQPRGKVVIALR
jgi:threonine dehydrogenase-like Zn-dependent dehydrogenase